MKNTKINLLIVVVSLFAWSCNNKENKGGETTSLKSEKVVEINSPCDFISLEEVESMFVVDMDNIEMQNVVLTHPTCIFKWEDGKVFNQSYIENTKVKVNLPSELLIVMAKDISDTQFNTVVKVYKDAQSVNNLGEMAVWGKKISQLSFLYKNYLFHVHVKVSNDDEINKEKAIEVAKLILGKL